MSAFVDALLPDLRALRHDIHRRPELGFEETETQAKVRAWLEAHGYEPKNCAKTGLVADLNPGAPGPTIALRADLDALAMQEDTDLPYKSENAGTAHKCGHDGHTSILCGVAAVLAARRAEFEGNVRLLFQPDEEGRHGGGAPVMIEEGALEGVEAVYGLHNWPGFPKGTLRVKAGPTMAEVHTLTLRLRGKGGHASEPQIARDPVAAAAQMVTALNSIVSRGVGHRGGAVLSICKIQSGTTWNVIPDEAEILGTVRTFDAGARDRVLARIEEVVHGTARAMGVDVEMDLLAGYPVLVNDADCADRVARAGAAVFGAENVSAEGLPLGASEDFAFFAAARPSAYFFLGAGDPVGDTPGCHHPHFDFDDDLIAPGIRTFVGIVEDRFGVGR